jgi:CysZ protein
MNRVPRALKQALESCLDVRILLLLFVPFFLAVVFAVILFLTAGTLWVASLSGWFQHTQFAEHLNQQWQLAGMVNSVSYIITLLLVVLITLPLAYVLSVMVVSVFLMPILLHILDQKGFSVLQKKRGGTVLGNLWNTLKASAVYMILLVGTLPFWLFPGFAIVLPVVLGAFLNKKVFVYDVLEGYASKEEMAEIEATHRKSLYALGVVLGLLNYLPLTFVVMPVFAGLAYSYFCLNALKELRDNRPT